MDLFDLVREKTLYDKKPLAERMKPKSFDDFFGQEHILSSGKMLRRVIEADRLTSIILHGPTGTGKTSLARIISSITHSNFVTLNAVMSGVKDIKRVVEDAKMLIETESLRTIVFIDEIHRFNKSQQDALLPHVEEGTIILIGATTENPYFEVNSALISRSMVFELQKLSDESIVKIIDNALDSDISLKEKNIEITESVKLFIAKKSSGDARKALNSLELAVLTTEENKGAIRITEEVAAECIQRRFIDYDKKGDNHYDIISAFIKSVRGSDPDAAVYYLAQMLISGEDPKFIARRLVILASEDVGLANSNALTVATSAVSAVNFVGMPEARIILSHATIYLALSPKSNSAYLAIKKAYNVVNEEKTAVPNHLRDGTNKRMRNIDADYVYPHSLENAYADQQYLPDDIADVEIYSPKKLGEEKELTEWIEKIKRK